MQLKLHHVNLCSKDVPAMDAFYRSVVGLETEPTRRNGLLPRQSRFQFHADSRHRS